MSHKTPWSGFLEEGTYEIEMSPCVLIGNAKYGFVQWDNLSKNPIRTLELQSSLSILATYTLVTTPISSFIWRG